MAPYDSERTQSQIGLASLEGTPFASSRLLAHRRVTRLYTGGANPSLDELLGVYPVALEVGPSGKCNSSCGWCNHKAEWANNRGDLPLESYQRLIDEVTAYEPRKRPKAVIFSSSGEPTMNRNFPDFVEYTAANGLEVSLITNGTNLHQKPDIYRGPEIKERMVQYGTWMRISLNAGTAKTRKKIHGVGDFEEIIGEIGTISEMIEDPAYKTFRRERGLPERLHLGAQMVVEPGNAHEVEEFVERMSTSGVQYAQIKPVVLQVHDTPPPEWDMERGQLSAAFWEPVMAAGRAAKERFETEDFKVHFKEDQFGGLNSPEQGRDAFGACRKVFAPVLDVTQDGKLLVYHCSQTRGDPEFLLGEITEETTFKDVWEGERRREIVATIQLPKCQIFCRNWGDNAKLQELSDGGLDPEEVARAKQDYAENPHVAKFI